VIFFGIQGVFSLLLMCLVLKSSVCLLLQRSNVHLPSHSLRLSVQSESIIFIRLGIYIPKIIQLILKIQLIKDLFKKNFFTDTSLYNHYTMDFFQVYYTQYC